MNLIETSPEPLSDELYSCYQVVANIAMQRVAHLLETFLQVFVIEPVPEIKLLKSNELHKVLHITDMDDSCSAVCQGFIGEGISGEAMLVFNDSCFQDISKLLKYKGEIDDSAEIELIMDIAGILIGSCIKGIGDQLDISFSQGHPVVLGQHSKVSDLVDTRGAWKQTLAIEIDYIIKDHNINCDLLLLFTEDTIDTLNKKVSHIKE